MVFQLLIVHLHILIIKMKAKNKFLKIYNHIF